MKKSCFDNPTRDQPLCTQTILAKPHSNTKPNPNSPSQQGLAFIVPPPQRPEIAHWQIITITAPITALLPHGKKVALTGAIVKLAIRVLAIHVVIAPLRIRQTGDLHRRSGQIDLGGRIRVVACPRALHQEVASGPFEEGREIPGFAVVVLLVKGIGDVNTAASALQVWHHPSPESGNTYEDIPYNVTVFCRNRFTLGVEVRRDLRIRWEH